MGVAGFGFLEKPLDECIELSEAVLYDLASGGTGLGGCAFDVREMLFQFLLRICGDCGDLAM